VRVIFNHFGAKVSNEHEYSCSKTSQKNTIVRKTVDVPSAFVLNDMNVERESDGINKSDNSIV